jgi:hypothetical protein
VSNLIAVNLIKDGDSKKLHLAMNKLKRAEAMAENNERGLAMTYNNMACFYKK